MFGGLCFLIGGNMCCGIVDDVLMVRVGAGTAAETDFANWVDRGSAFARSLPPE